MENFDKKKHWENIYLNKKAQDLSWFQTTPDTSINFLKQFKIPKAAKIIDVGGGDSFFVDFLLDLGYEDITVLDISEIALNKAKQRLGNNASKVKWILADAASFVPIEKYDFWHDRAAFHFLTKEVEIDNYVNSIQTAITPGGVLVIGTFSENGPKACSGIAIKQYSEKTMAERLAKFFKKIKCITVNHYTPLNTIQNFIFCSFLKVQSS